MEEPPRSLSTEPDYTRVLVKTSSGRFVGGFHEFVAQCESISSAMQKDLTKRPGWTPLRGSHLCCRDWPSAISKPSSRMRRRCFAHRSDCAVHYPFNDGQSDVDISSIPRKAPQPEHRRGARPGIKHQSLTTQKSVSTVLAFTLYAMEARHGAPQQSNGTLVSQQSNASNKSRPRSQSILTHLRTSRKVLQ